MPSRGGGFQSIRAAVGRPVDGPRLERAKPRTGWRIRAGCVCYGLSLRRYERFRLPLRQDGLARAHDAELDVGVVPDHDDEPRFLIEPSCVILYAPAITSLVGHRVPVIRNEDGSTPPLYADLVGAVRRAKDEGGGWVVVRIIQSPKPAPRPTYAP